MREALGVAGERGFEDGGALHELARREAVVDVMRREQPEADVVMLAVVPRKEVDAVPARVLKAAEVIGKIG